MVYVINKNNRPLMPIRRHGKVRRLLKSGKAKVIRKEPFTIKLLFDTGSNVSNLTLGIDTGSATIGTAVVDKKQVVYYTSEVQIRNDITTKMERRAIYRRARRTRKLRYRKARFDNRANSKRTDRFSPTMTSKINSHCREIDFVKSILPIATLVIEAGKFDVTLLNHKDEAFNRHWGYQRGPAYGFKNNHEAVLSRDNYTCQCCRTKKGTMNTHHILPKSQGGSDEMENLITLCESCHSKLHKGELKDFEARLKGKRKGTLKYATQMNSIRKQVFRRYPEAFETYGFVTKANRELSDLPKEHWADAVTIAIGGVPSDVKVGCYMYRKRHIAAGEYQRSQGQRSEKEMPKGKLFGFNLYDKVEYFGTLAFIGGRQSKGYFGLVDIDGEYVSFENLGRGLKTPKYDKIRLLSRRKTTLCIRKRITLKKL